MATHYLDHHLALLAHLRGILVALGEAEQVEDDSHALFLERFDELAARTRRLAEENRSLRQQHEQVSGERAQLLAKNEQARSRVEAMIARLKALEQHT